MVIYRNCVKCGTLTPVARGMECDRCVNERLERERSKRNNNDHEDDGN